MLFAGDAASEEERERYQRVCRGAGDFMIVVAKESRRFIDLVRAAGPVTPAQEELFGHWTRALDGLEQTGRECILHGATPAATSVAN